MWIRCLHFLAENPFPWLNSGPDFAAEKGRQEELYSGVFFAFFARYRTFGAAHMSYRTPIRVPRIIS